MSKFREFVSILAVGVFVTIATTGCYEPSEYTAFGDGERVVVIDGRVTDADSISTVVVTRSVSALSDSDCEFVDNAIVFLRDDQGNSAQLTNKGGGVYRTTEINGTIGNRYLLTVEVEGEHYSSKCPPECLSTRWWLSTVTITPFSTPLATTYPFTQNKIMIQHNTIVLKLRRMARR